MHKSKTVSGSATVRTAIGIVLVVLLGIVEKPHAEPVQADSFREDWNFRFGEISASATWQDAADHPDCTALEAREGALSAAGCRHAVEVNYRVPDGDMAMTNLFLVMADEESAGTLQDGFRPDDLRLPEAHRTGPAREGRWIANAVGEIVLVTLVTAEEGVPDATIRHYAHFGNSDFSVSLMWREPGRQPWPERSEGLLISVGGTDPK